MLKKRKKAALAKNKGSSSTKPQAVWLDLSAFFIVDIAFPFATCLIWPLLNPALCILFSFSDHISFKPLPVDWKLFTDTYNTETSFDVFHLSLLSNSQICGFQAQLVREKVIQASLTPAAIQLKAREKRGEEPQTLNILEAPTQIHI